MSFRPNPALAIEWEKSPEARRMLMEVAGKVAQQAQDLAPIKTGDYQASITAVEENGKVRVVASDHKSGWIEFGTSPGHGHSGTPAYAPLRRGAEAEGLKVEARRAK